MGVNVLIVDRSAVMRKILERALRQACVQIDHVVEASDGVEALERLQAGGGIQVIFSELNMPNMDGIEFLSQVKQSDSFRRIPVVMVTTEGTEARVREALSLGAAGYVKKPFTPAQMQTALRRAITLQTARSVP